MIAQEFEDNKCRVCWNDNVEVDWNALLSSHSHLTYKDCFYKFTRLEVIDEDKFSNLICRNCSNGLEYIEEFISKAIDTYVKLHNVYLLNKTGSNSETMYMVDEIEIKEKIESPTFCEETLKQITTPPYENKTVCIIERPTKRIRKLNKKEKTKNARNTKIKVENERKIKCEGVTNEQSQATSKLKKSKNKKSNIKSLLKDELKNTSPTLMETEFIEMKENKCEIYESTSDTLLEQNLNKISDAESRVSLNAPKSKQGGEYKKIYMCQYCSTQLKGISKLKAHEALHSENRERRETCPQCGVKFFTKGHLRLHLQTHDSKREKKYKCEFCEKAFYNNSTLNVHKRVHLGLMVKCQICSKEFFRKIELHNHMQTHSGTLINVEVKKRSRYMVRCKYCSKEILSTSFRSHTAAHLNQPLMKCSICNKEFFRRASCRHHLKTFHKKKTAEMKDLIIIYEKNRLNHLYLRQTADILENED